MDKESIMKSEKFARKIINLAAQEGLTVKELCNAAEIAMGASYNSTVEWEAVAKTDFPSSHIVTTCDEKELFEISKRVGNPAFNC